MGPASLASLVTLLTCLCLPQSVIGEAHGLSGLTLEAAHDAVHGWRVWCIGVIVIVLGWNYAELWVRRSEPIVVSPVTHRHHGAEAVRSAPLGPGASRPRSIVRTVGSHPVWTCMHHCNRGAAIVLAHSVLQGNVIARLSRASKCGVTMAHCLVRNIRCDLQ